jgi:excisionase family DNA binding protein
MARAQNLISLAEAADLLGVHYMTAYRYVRTGRLAAVKAGQEWQVDERDVHRLRDQRPATATAATAPAPPPARPRRADHGARLVDRLLHDDEAGAWTLIDDALAGGMTPAEAYLTVLAPSLAVIGRRWEAGEITVADEHRASAIMLRLLGRLGPRFARRGRKRGTVLLGTAPGDRHGLPTALLRDLLRGRSFDVIDLGADVPLDSWTATVAATPRLAGVGLCATVPGNDDGVRAAIGAVRAATDVPVVLGGVAVTGEAHAGALGATAYSASFEDAVRLFADGGRRAPGPAAGA